jgi:glucan phosphoethanolaminetransferase (alkaline phosphatase superfamily)
MKLTSVLFCVAATSILAQQAVPVTVAKNAKISDCATAVSIPQCVAVMIETTENPDEAIKIAKQAGMEAFFSKSKDGRDLIYVIRNPKNGQQAIVKKKL